MERNMDIVNLLVINDACPVKRSMYGSTAIREASKLDDPEMLNCLLKPKTDVDIADCFGVTPLFISAMCGNVSQNAKCLIVIILMFKAVTIVQQCY